MITLVVGLVLIVPLWRICARAGVRPWLALLVFVPTVGVLLVATVLAFCRWPNLPVSGSAREGVP